MKNFIVDCPTRRVKLVIKVLGKKVNIQEVATYAMDRHITRISFTSELTEEQLEKKLFNNKDLLKVLDYYDTLAVVESALN